MEWKFKVGDKVRDKEVFLVIKENLEKNNNKANRLKF